MKKVNPKDNPEGLDEEALERRARNAARIAASARTQLIRRLKWLSVAPVILVTDQISKWYVMEQIMRPLAQTGQEPHGFWDWYIGSPVPVPFTSIPVSSFFNLVMAWNTGVSFSLLDSYGIYGTWLLVIIALAIVAMFSVWFYKTKDPFHAICFATIIGGALGNVLDRVRFGAVIDFLDFHIWGYHWPAFNVADMAVVSGVVLLIIVSFILDVKRKQRYRSRGHNI